MIYLGQELMSEKHTALTFAVFHFTESENMYHIDQDFYMSNIEQIPADVELRLSPIE